MKENAPVGKYLALIKSRETLSAQRLSVLSVRLSTGVAKIVKHIPSKGQPWKTSGGPAAQVMLGSLSPPETKKKWNKDAAQV